jgi:raffinose/stachyose/melibiose transport system permease protein
MLSERGFLYKLKTYILFAGPTTFFFITVIILPFIFGIYLTFTNWDGISANYSYVNFENYKTVLTDQVFWGSFFLTIKYVIATVLLSNVVAFFFAYLLTGRIKGHNFFRVGFFTPNLIGGIILGFLWTFIFSNVFVYFGKITGIELFAGSWLADPEKAFWALVIVTVWQQSGYMMIIYIAGLMNVPKEVLEASEIDGASEFQKIKNIMIPLIVPSFVFCIFMGMQRGFMVYELNLALTKGGPFRSTELISMNVYRLAFTSQQYGPGQAEAFFLFVMVVTAAILQVYFTKRLEVEL